MLNYEDFNEIVTEAKSFWDAVARIVELIKSLLTHFDVCSSKEELINMANRAIDAAVAIDIPYIPNMAEILLDELISDAAKDYVKELIDHACP